MSKNDKNLVMREEIIKVAMRLFYEQGYKDTLFAHIAKELDVTKGLITYYFGTKANLAQEVHTDFITDIHNEITFQVYTKYHEYFKYEPRLIMSLSNLCSLHMYRTDEHARRFYVEHMSDNFQISIEQTQLSLYFEQRRKYNRSELEQTEYVRMVAFSERAARAAVVLGYFRGKLDLSFEEMVDYTLSVNYRMERAPEKQTNELIEKTKEVYKALNIQIDPYFKIKIK